MGVAWVFECNQTVASLERQMMLVGAELLGSYTVDCTPYIPNETGISHMYLMHHSQFPQTTFSIMPNETFKTSPRASFDKGFDLIISKLGAGLQPDLAGKFQVSGNEYAMKDFRVRIGTATQGVVGKGVLVEVEYGPSCLASQCIQIITEFIEMYFPTHKLTQKPEVLQKSQPEHYGGMETLYQYCLLFIDMRQRT